MNQPKDDKHGAAPGTNAPAPTPEKDRTFVGVPPLVASAVIPNATTETKATLPPPREPGGSAIIAAPMISVAGGATAKPSPRIALQAPREAAPPKGPSPSAGQTRNVQGGWRNSSPPPSADSTLIHSSPARIQPVAPATPRVAQPAPPRPSLSRPPTPPAPRVARSTPPPGYGDVNRTALSSEYLAAARDDALARASTSPGRATPGATDRPPPPTGQEPPPTAPLSEVPLSEVKVAPITALPPGGWGSGALAPQSKGAHHSAQNGPHSFATQPSVAPPLLEAHVAPLQSATPGAPGTAHRPQGARLQGTMVELAQMSLSSIDIPVADFRAPAAPPGLASARFEPVSSSRGPLAHQPAGLPPLPDLGDGGEVWDPPSTPPNRPTRSRTLSMPSTPRLLALGVILVGAIAFAVLNGPRAGGFKEQRPSVSGAAGVRPNAPPTTATADQATLANHPAEVPAPITGSPPPANAGKRDLAGSPDRAVNPESHLGAQAAEHVMAGRYSDALPLYEQLARQSPQNTAYAVTANILRKKLSMTPTALPPAAAQ